MLFAVLEVTQMPVLMLELAERPSMTGWTKIGGFLTILPRKCRRTLSGESIQQRCIQKSDVKRLWYNQG
nr:MAG TPA: hypothetical protein [Caudoviricetes sp.]